MTIAASDDAHGVFQFSPKSLLVNGTEPEDGRSSVVLQVSLIQAKNLEFPSQARRDVWHTVVCFVFVLSQVDRSFGDLSNVTVYWETDPSSEGELLSRSGNITFGVGQISQNVTINVAQDEIPELDESFIVSLVNVSHGRLGDETSSTLTVLASDDPYGVFTFANVTRSVRLPEADATVSLTIVRQRGLMGEVCPVDGSETL